MKAKFKVKLVTARDKAGSLLDQVPLGTITQPLTTSENESKIAWGWNHRSFYSHPHSQGPGQQEVSFLSTFIVSPLLFNAITSVKSNY